MLRKPESKHISVKGFLGFSMPMILIKNFLVLQQTVIIMKYIVKRTSEFWDHHPQIEGAQNEMVPYIYGENNSELRETHTIEINSLEELHSFIHKWGEPVVIFNPNEDGTGFRFPEIEIYDDYRE